MFKLEGVICHDATGWATGVETSTKISKQDHVFGFHPTPLKKIGLKQKNIWIRAIYHHYGGGVQRCLELSAYRKLGHLKGFL